MWTYAVWPGTVGPRRGRRLVTGGRDDASSRRGEEALEERPAVRDRPELGEDLARHGAEEEGPGSQPLGQGDGVEPGGGEHRLLEQGPHPGFGGRREETELVGAGEPSGPPDVVEQRDEQDE